ETDVAQDGERAMDVRLVGEEFPGLVHRQAQDTGDVPAAVLDLQGLRVEPRAVTRRTGRVDAGQEQELHHHEAFALTVLAPPFRHVEGEAPGVIVARARRLR